MKNRIPTKLEKEHFIYGPLRCMAMVWSLILLFTAGNAFSQYASDGQKSKGFEGGAPAGSYSLSDFEHINLYNGNLNFNMPLAALGGRGNMLSPVTIAIDSAKWHVDIDPTERGWMRLPYDFVLNSIAVPHWVVVCPPTHAQRSPDDDGCEWQQELPTDFELTGEHISALTPLTPDVRPLFQVVTDPEYAAVRGVVSLTGQTVNFGNDGNYAVMLTRLTLTDQNGNKYELRDALTDGKPNRYQIFDDPTSQYPRYRPPFNRGRTFVTADGENIRFVSDTDIVDESGAATEPLQPYYPTGNLYYPDGRVYRVYPGGTEWMRDVNGNTITSADSIGRTITQSYDVLTNNPNDTSERYDEVITKSAADTDRVTRVYKTRLHNMLRQDYPSIRNTGDMFPEVLDAFYVSGSDYDPEGKMSKIILPDGREYRFRYNPYGELARVELPTGAAIEYDFYQATTGPQYQSTIFRPLLERRVYASGGSSFHNDIPDQKLTYLNELITSPAGTRVTVKTFAKNDTSGVLEEKTKDIHYFYGDSHNLTRRFYSPWAEGKEFRSETLEPRTSTVRRRVDTEWENPSSGNWGSGEAALRPAENPRVKSVTTNITEGANTLTSKVAYDYDDTNTYNNRTDEWMYDYGTNGFPGRILKHTQTGYLKVNADNNNLDYTSDAIHMYSLPAWTKVYDVKPDLTEQLLSQTETKYDEAAYAPLTYGGTPVGWTDPATTARGNPTTSSIWFAEENRWVQTHARYDQFGNLRKSWDTSDISSRYTETEYSADYQYAFPTKVTTPPPGDGQHGSSESSFASTAYNFYTGQPVSVTDQFGQTIATEYNDPLDRPTRNYGANLTAPESQVEYGDTVGSLFVKTKKQLDATNWDESTKYFDGLGRTIKAVAKDTQGEVIVETHYDGMGRVDRETSPYRVGDTIYWSKIRFDELGRAVETYAPATIEDINSNNLVTLGVTAFANSTITGFVGPVVTATDASGRKSRSITNALGQLVRVDEPTAMGGTETADLGALATPAQATLYTYDVFGRMVKVQQGAQNRYFKYNSLGQLIRISQPEQEYNTNLNLSDLVNTSGHWTAGFAYDSLGRVIRSTDANGVNTVNEYDLAGRVVKRCYTKPNVSTSATTCSAITSSGDENLDTHAVDFWYDGTGLDSVQAPYNYAKGKLTKITNGISQTKNTLFDNFGRIKSTEQKTPVGTETMTDAPGRVSTYFYNLSGALTEETYPSGRTVKNEYESDGDLMRISGTANANAAEQTYANGFSYTPDGKIKQLRLGSGLWESARFNTRLQATELALGHSVGDGSLWKLGYEYGELESNGSVNTTKNTGNIARQTVSFSGITNPFVQSYTYDPLYRLTEARETSGSGSSAPQTWKQTFGYDLYGNRTAFTQDVGGQQLTINNLTLPSIDSTTNRFQANQGYTYDKTGNLTHDPASSGRTFVFNAENKQTQVKDSNSSPVGTYYYDGEGKRVKKVTATETTVFVYSGAKLIAEYSTASPPTNPTTTFTATDKLGSPRVLTNSFGQLVSRRDFMPFGEELYADGTNRTTAGKYSQTGQDSVRKRFTGYEKDTETNLDFAEARYYNNQHARFTAVDPLLASGKSGNPQSFNRYAYVLNNPLILTDPTGMQVASDLGPCTGNCEGNFHVESNTVYGGIFNAVVESVFASYASLRDFYRPGMQELIETRDEGGSPDTSRRILGSKSFTARQFFWKSNEHIAERAATLHSALQFADITGQASFALTAYKWENGKASNFEFGVATAGAVFSAATFGEVPGPSRFDGLRLYKGVPETYEFFNEAKSGTFIPIGGHDIPWAYSDIGDIWRGRSQLSSWTPSLSQAIGEAHYEGVVLVRNFPQSNLFPWRNAENKLRFLVKGKVTGATPREVWGPGFKPFKLQE